MGCISPDGTPTESGKKMLLALQKGLKSPQDIAKETGLPLFRVRSGLRDIAVAGLAEQKGDSYELSPKGTELVASLR
jgi:predicted transcriptional regulator